jgi:hypothetical protein
MTATEAAALLDPEDDEELVAAAVQAEEDANGEHVAGFGCQSADRVFLAAVPGQRHRPYTLTIPQCPGCGKSHEIKAMPRPRKLSDEIAVSVDPPDDPTPPTAGPRNAPKSDADVLAAIPDDWAPVTDVAVALGYGNRMSLVNRLREMRERGAAIETRKEHRSAPMFVRRAVKP